MCRNIRPLFNFEPPATKEEIMKASEQFVKKISGFNKPSKVNEIVFSRAIEKISEHIEELLQALTTNAKPRNREEEAEKRRLNNLKRFNKSSN